jgi:hypothetical protein
VFSLDFNYGNVVVTGLTLVIALDGTYNTEPTYSMVKSTDGYAWSATCINNIPYEITAIECSDNYSVDKTVYVAVDTNTSTPGPTSVVIYRCANAAVTTEHPDEFGPIFAVAGGGTNYASRVYSMDSYYDGSDVWLLTATDLDVFAIPDDRGLTTTWTDMQLSETLGGDYADGVGVGGVEVFKAMFAPDYASAGFIWALYLDDEDGASSTNTNGYGLISRKTGSTTWGNVITPEIISAGTDFAKSTCDLEFAADYSSTTNPNLYAALSFVGDNTEDDIYSIECDFYGSHGTSAQFDVDTVDRVDFCSLEVYGSLLVASTFDYGTVTDPNYNTQIWYSLNDGVTWDLASKNPTGDLDRYSALLISKYGTTAGMVFVGTGGEQSAISISEDDGDTWNQIAFIDDTLYQVTDIAFDPTGTSAALVTINASGNYSLWKTADVTAVKPQWQRTLCEGYSTTIAAFTMVEYSNDGTVAMLYDSSVDKIYRSSNDLQTFSNWKNTASWGDINDWVVYDSATVYAACDNGFWSTAVVGSDISGVTLASVAIQSDFDPDDADNGVIIVGGIDGKVYTSFNAGDDFESGVTVKIGAHSCTGTMYVAFDSDNLVYFAASEGYAGYGILAVDGAGASVTVPNGGPIADGAFYYLNILGVKIGGGSPLVSSSATSGNLGDILVDIVISADDTLYVLDDDGDVYRYLLNDLAADTYQSDWDIMEDGSITADELFVTSGSNVLWTFDTNPSATSPKVLLADDTLTGAVTGLTVTNIGPFSATISWTAMTDATDYLVMVFAYDEDDEAWDIAYVGIIPLVDYTDETAVVLFGLDDSTEYKVSVRVDNDDDISGSYSYLIDDQIEFSRFGNSSFTTDYYVDTPRPTNPQQGEQGTTLNPTFGWSSVPDAVTYTFQLSSTPDFSSIIDNVSVATTGYTYAGDALAYNTAYYWRVQAVGPDGTVSKWSSYSENYFSITLAEFAAQYEDLVEDLYGVFRNGDLVFYWTSGAISSFNTIVDPANYQDTLTVELPDVTTTSTSIIVTADIPNITIDPPTITATVNIPTQQTTVTSINLVVPDNQTPVYIWAIVAIGALLTVAVIVLIIRTRRVV